MSREVGAEGMKPETKPGNELAKLKFEKKNQSMAKLPPNMTVERRPLIHAPVASPFAGARVHKVVYVSRNTPIMAAVKRVKKLLLHVEKRAMQGVDLIKDRNGMRKLAEANEKLGKNGEAVLVKASGRAMEQALKVGEWFRNREDELACTVEVRTGSVQAVDDIVEKEADERAAEDQPENVDETSAMDSLDTSLLSACDGPEGSTQPLPNQTSGQDDSAGPVPTNENAGELVENSTNTVSKGEETQKTRKRRGKRKKSVLDEDTSARIRWVKTVEVSISLKC
jgi:ribonuclease P/MRP protein subunit POP7